MPVELLDFERKRVDEGNGVAVTRTENRTVDSEPSLTDDYEAIAFRLLISQSVPCLLEWKNYKNKPLL
ncbi:hypothetical protein J6590_090801 [Homalodisca vitripennis]|nr:hypothetical protein J6590_090801 [Homalodisca vitripennis]